MNEHATRGVLLVNLGSPAEPTPRAVRRFLREFLCDPRVVDLPRIAWRPLLECVVLPARSKRSAHAYASIWTSEGSPLVVHTRAQARLLADRLGRTFVVEHAMRYGEPRIPDALAALAARGAVRIAVVPLFPQFSESTNGSVAAEIDAARAKLPATLDVRVVPAAPEDPLYVEALAERFEAATGCRAIDHAVLSFHGLPERYVRRGDPYRDHCERTARALATRLGLASDRWTLAYQSRFGPERWLRPATDEVVLAWAKRGARVAITMPGFAADCLETLEEIGLRLSERFRTAGGREWIVVPALNESPTWIESLAAQVERALSSAATRTGTGGGSGGGI